MKELTAEKAIMQVARGKAGTCCIQPTPEGHQLFIGFGLRRPIQMLRLVVNGDVFTETTNTFCLFMRIGSRNENAWCVLTDNDLNPFVMSGNMEATISCVAFIEPQAKGLGEQPDADLIPICLKARFDSRCSSLVISRDDVDFLRLLLAEEQERVLACPGKAGMQRWDNNA